MYILGSERRHLGSGYAPTWGRTKFPEGVGQGSRDTRTQRHQGRDGTADGGQGR